jgi:hypothetical protein
VLQGTNGSKLKMKYTGHDINKVRNFVINSTMLGRYSELVLLELLALVKRDHELKLNRERQQRYHQKDTEHGKDKP